MTTLTRNDILKRLPHRLENILLDECTLLDDSTCKYSLTINDPDILGREIFSIKSKSMLISTPIIAEISALASIIGSGTIEPGTFAYFAAISNFSTNSIPFKINVPINGITKRTSSKNGFFKYQFELSSGDSSAKGQIMAFYDKNMTDLDSPPSPLELPSYLIDAMQGSKDPVKPFKNKPRLMTFIDSCYQLDSKKELLYSYQYPLSHPLIQGHFPGNPVMMGVCQWQMLEDALLHYFSNINELPSSPIACSALIFKRDLTPVCEIKNARLEFSNSVYGPYITTTSVKKILFKQRVLPADQLYLQINISD